MYLFTKGNSYLSSKSQNRMEKNESHYSHNEDANEFYYCNENEVKVKKIQYSFRVLHKNSSKEEESQ